MSEELIIKLIEEQDEKRAIQIKGIQKAMDAGFTTLSDKMGEIVEQNKVRNHRIECVENETRVVRWFHKNPVKAVIIAVAFVFAVAVAFHSIDLAKTLKNRTGIELKDK